MNDITLADGAPVPIPHGDVGSADGGTERVCTVDDNRYRAGLGSDGFELRGVELDLAARERHLPDLLTTVSRHFVRAESRQRAADYLMGLLSTVPRKNGWRLAEHAHHRSPDGIQWLLNGAAWDADRMRDDIARYVGRYIGDTSAVLAVDDVGFVKRGQNSCGVDRQRNGFTGKTENCQVAVFLAYASAAGRALVDRELYLPRSWSVDTARRRTAGVPASVTYRSKAALAKALIERALRSSLPFQWVTAGQSYATPELQEFCARAGLSFVFEVSAHQPVRLPAGRRMTAGEVNPLLPEHAFELHRAAGDGGVEEHGWAVVRLNGLDGLLIRRDQRPAESAHFYLCHANRPVGLAEWIRVAQSRSTVVECLEEARRYAGLDDYEVRKYVSWHRHVTMALLAYAFLAVNRSRLGAKES